VTATAAACSIFHGKEIRPLGFSRRGELIGERSASEGGLGWLTPWWHGQTLAYAALGCGQPLAPLRLIFGLREASVKIEGLAFISSNFENISCVAFLKLGLQKKLKDREWLEIDLSFGSTRDQLKNK
jgi:hypothetical protein